MRRMNMIGGVMLRQVPILGAWRPTPYRKSMAEGPWVEVKPNVNVSPNLEVKAPINIELGGLPLSIGLFAGSGLVFLVRSALPEGWPQAVALVAGAGLAAGGIVNLILPKKAAPPVAGSAPSAAAPPPPPAPSAAGGGAAGPSPSYTLSIESAFNGVTGRISSPGDFSTVDIPAWASTYPVRVQLSNPASVPVTFELEMTAEEDPQPVGKSATSSLPIQVTLNPGEVRDVDINMPIATWGALQTYVDIALTARKRRAPGEDAQLIDQRSFNVT